MRPCFSTVCLLMTLMVFGCGDAGSTGVSVGDGAVDFTLPGIDEKMVTLSDYNGKTVVLEWVNHGCPFVKKHYNSGNMQGLQRAYTQKGVVWLSICSSAPGKQGYFKAEKWLELTTEKGASPTAVLLDLEGDVGRQYGAKTTPHMYVINPEGALVYKGAIDDRPSADPQDVATAHNYLSAALEETLAGEEVSVASTQPYGCSVKY
jgi:peroxiredoxin